MTVSTRSKEPTEGRFTKLPSWAMQPGIPPLPRLVLITLITHDWNTGGKRKGYAHPKQGSMASALGISRKAVVDAYRWLEDCGALTCIGYEKNGGAQRMRINYDADLGCNGALQSIVTVGVTKAAQEKPDESNPTLSPPAAATDEEIDETRLTPSVTTDRQPQHTAKPARSRQAIAAMVAFLTERASPDLATDFAMMGDYSLFYDDAIALAVQFGARRLTEACLLFYARHKRGEDILKPGAFIRAAITRRYEFNRADADAIQAMYDEAVDAVIESF